MIPLIVVGRINIIVPVIARKAILMGYDKAMHSIGEQRGINPINFRIIKPGVNIYTTTNRIVSIMSI